MGYEYKAIGAPEKGRKRRGAKTRSDRVAAALETILETEAKDGWEYLRTDLIPVEERSGWFGRSQEVHRAVMVFRRALEGTGAASISSEASRPTLRATPKATPESGPESGPKPAREADAQAMPEPMAAVGAAVNQAADARAQPLFAKRSAEPVAEPDTETPARKLVAD